MKEFRLNNGVSIPSIGYGTWRVPESELCYNSVKQALACGFKHIDTAAFYQNERSIGKAVADSGINRNEIFITSKLWNSEHTYERTLAAFDKTITNLGVDYLDLYLIHWPVPVDFKDNWEEANAETWRAFEELYERGKIRAIGVSNFKPHHIETLMKTAKIKPMVNQIELHPGLNREEEVEYCKSQDILVEAWAPFAVGEVFKQEKLLQIAENHSRTVAQIVLRWFLQKGILPLPKSTTGERIVDNICVFDFELSDEEMSVINSIKADELNLHHDSDNIDF